MANTLALRRRIKTAQNVSKTTRAMQMIAASKLKRAQSAVVASRPYVTSLMRVSQHISSRENNSTTVDTHPYVKLNINNSKTLYIIISPDKGLCGGLITNLFREYVKIKQDTNALFVTLGKKIESPIAANSKNLIASFPFGNTIPSFEMVLPLLEIIDDYYLSGKISTVKVITTHFNSIFSQTPHIEPLLPLILPKDTNISSSVDIVFEPSKEDLLPALAKRYIEMVLYQQILESYASEQAARMIAMQNATNNAKDIVNSLQLLYNKARQEKITNEILDISSATVAMEGK